MMKRPWAEACRDFSWEPSLRALGWTTTGDVNLGVTIVDRHAASGATALRWFGKDGRRRSLSFDELARLSNQVANLLTRLGVEKGDCVAGFLPRIPQTLAVMLGAWKAGAIYVPIFTGFGPDAVRFRLEDSGAKVLFTQWEHRSRVPAPLPNHAVVVTVSGRAPLEDGDAEFQRSVGQQPETFAPVWGRRDDPAVLLYTSGSTGAPKGVKIANNFVLAIHPYMTYAVDVRPDDVYWPTGDPGWGYGLVCYMVALAMGITVLSHEAAPTPEYFLRQISELGITNLGTTPTLLRGVMALGEQAVRRSLSRVRVVSSCGEPLNAEVVSFFQRVWGVTPMDQYGASEMGLPIGNFNALDMAVKPGSMGLPLPGCHMAVVDDDGYEVAAEVVGHVGQKTSETGYYALGYWSDEERTASLDRGGWVTIGDLARRDAEGYFWFEGRADDVIKSAGYRIGPFEVESAILCHPAVAEAAVVGKPDPLRGQIVKAYVVLKPGTSGHAALGEEIVEVVKARVGKHQYPREVEFVPSLPKTETGKIQRFQLRQA